jgi:hypothetical protein
MPHRLLENVSGTTAWPAHYSDFNSFNALIFGNMQ